MCVCVYIYILVSRSLTGWHHNITCCSQGFHLEHYILHNEFISKFKPKLALVLAQSRPLFQVYLHFQLNLA